MISQNAPVTLKIIKEIIWLAIIYQGKLNTGFIMNTVNGSFKSGLDVSLSICSTTWKCTGMQNLTGQK